MGGITVSRIPALLALLGVVAAVGSALAALGAGLGVRLGWWHYREGISVLVYVFWTALGTAGACLVIAGFNLARASRRALALALAGVLVAGVTAWIPYNLRMTASSVPPIHDITTDLADPPKFVKVVTLRKPGDHPAEYDGPKAGELQKKGYPDLAAQSFPVPKDKVAAAASKVLADMGLEIVEADPAQGRVEATATSTLFGFKDDVVVRIAEANGAAHVDLRSKSRVGRNDFGMNAKRIREFQARLKAALA